MNAYNKKGSSLGLKMGGWQANVEYFKTYVIKTPKTEKEISETIERYLRHTDNLDELGTKVKEMQADWDYSLDLVKKKKIPLHLFANLEFLPHGKIKQTRVKMLGDVITSLYKAHKIEGINSIFDKFFELIIELWEYGVVEKTSKIGQEFGILGERVVLVDIGELSEKKSTAEKQIAEIKWQKNLSKYCGQEIADLFFKRAKEKLNLELLEAHWGKKE